MKDGKALFLDAVNRARQIHEAKLRESDGAIDLATGMPFDPAEEFLEMERDIQLAYDMCAPSADDYAANEPMTTQP